MAEPRGHPNRGLPPADFLGALLRASALPPPQAGGGGGGSQTPAVPSPLDLEPEIVLKVFTPHPNKALPASGCLDCTLLVRTRKTLVLGEH